MVLSVHDARTAPVRRPRWPRAAPARAAQRHDLGVVAPGRLCRTLADHLAVAQDHAADPRVGRGRAPHRLTEFKCPLHRLVVAHATSRAPGARGSDGDGDDRQAADATRHGRLRPPRRRGRRVTRREAENRSHPLPSGLLPSAQESHLIGPRQAAVASRASTGGTDPVITAGRDFHPTPRAFGCS